MASRKAQALIKAARAGDAAARLQLGRLYLSGGEGLAASPPAAFHWLTLAGDCIEAAREIAARISPEAAAADPVAYARACRRAADGGSAAAQRALGELLLEGYGLPADPEAAREAFRLAAEAGDLAAAARLGELLIAQPDGTAEARLWLERAATHGNAAAGRRLAELLWRAGDEAAAPWLRSAAQAGDLEAACRLGELLADKGGETGREGMAWLERAARQGHARALWLYGRCYAGNLGGGG